MKQSQKAILATLFAAFLWSTAGVFVKIITWEPLAIAGGRSLIAAAILLPSVLNHPVKFSWPLLGASLSYAAFNFCFILSTKLTTSANAIMLQYAAPIYVAVLAYFFLGERVKKYDLISMGFVAAGMALFFLDSIGGGSLIGNLFGIGNGVAFAAMVLFLRMQKNGDPVHSMFFGSLLTSILSFPILLTSGLPSAQSVLALIATGCIVGVSYGIYASATKHLSALEAVLIPVIDPVLNPVWVYLTIGERPGFLSILGGLIVLTAITVKSVLSINNGEAHPSSS